MGMPDKPHSIPPEDIPDKGVSRMPASPPSVRPQLADRPETSRLLLRVLQEKPAQTGLGNEPAVPVSPADTPPAALEEIPLKLGDPEQIQTSHKEVPEGDPVSIGESARAAGQISAPSHLIDQPDKELHEQGQHVSSIPEHPVSQVALPESERVPADAMRFGDDSFALVHDPQDSRIVSSDAPAQVNPSPQSVHPVEEREVLSDKEATRVAYPGSKVEAPRKEELGSQSQKIDDAPATHDTTDPAANSVERVMLRAMPRPVEDTDAAGTTTKNPDAVSPPHTTRSVKDSGTAANVPMWPSDERISGYDGSTTGVPKAEPVDESSAVPYPLPGAATQSGRASEVPSSQLFSLPPESVLAQWQRFISSIDANPSVFTSSSSSQTARSTTGEVDLSTIAAASPVEKSGNRSEVKPVATVIRGAAHAVTSLEVQYLQKNPIGTVTVRGGARTIVKRGVPALALEEMGHITAEFLGSGLGGPIVQTVVNATIEGLVAPLIGYGLFKMAEGSVRALRPRAIKRYWAGRKMAREDRNLDRRELTMEKLAADARVRSDQLWKEVRSSPDKTIEVDALIVGDGPHGTEVKSVLHERGGRHTRVVSADRNDGIGGEFGQATTVFYYLNTSTSAARLGAGLFHRRGRNASRFAPGLILGNHNPAAMALDAARNSDDMGKGVKIYDRSPSDAGHMNPSHVSEFATGPNPRSDEKHLESMRNSHYAGPTMLGVEVKEILDDEATGRFSVPFEGPDGEVYKFKARAVVVAPGQGKESEALKDGRPHIYTSTEFLQDPEPIMQAIFNGQSIGVVAGLDSGSITMEGIVALVKAQRDILEEMRNRLSTDSKDLPEIILMQERLRNVKIHLFTPQFGDRDEYTIKTTNRYKSSLAKYIQFPEEDPRERTITIHPHKGYVYPHKDHTYTIERSADNFPVIGGHELGAVVTAIGRVPSILYYNGAPLNEQTDTVSGIHGLTIGERVPGKRIYVVGTAAHIPFRKEDPNQSAIVRAIKRRIPHFKPEDFYVTSQWEKRWVASLDRLIPRSTELGIQIERELNGPAFLRGWEKLTRRG